MGLFQKQTAGWLIVGLGNPDEQYRDTRHNAGFMALAKLAEKYGVSFKKSRQKAEICKVRIGGAPVILARPLTYMNRSGEAVRALASYYRIPMDRVVVVYDDIDLPAAHLRIRPSGGPGTHNGMRSIVQITGETGFPRVRVGVGAPPKEMDLVSYVLGKITPEAREAAEKAALAAEKIAEDGLDAAMREYNSPRNG